MEQMTSATDQWAVARLQGQVMACDKFRKALDGAAPPTD